MGRFARLRAKLPHRQEQVEQEFAPGARVTETAKDVELSREERRSRLAEAAFEGERGPPSNVILDLPTVKVDEITLEVDEITAWVVGPKGRWRGRQAQALEQGSAPVAAAARGPDPASCASPGADASPGTQVRASRLRDTPRPMIRTISSSARASAPRNPVSFGSCSSARATATSNGTSVLCPVSSQ